MEVAYICSAMPRENGMYRQTDQRPCQKQRRTVQPLKKLCF